MIGEYLKQVVADNDSEEFARAQGVNAKLKKEIK